MIFINQTTYIACFIGAIFQVYLKLKNIKVSTTSYLDVVIVSFGFCLEKFTLLMIQMLYIETFLLGLPEEFMR